MGGLLDGEMRSYDGLSPSSSLWGLYINICIVLHVMDLAIINI